LSDQPKAALRRADGIDLTKRSDPEMFPGTASGFIGAR
jgi:hypothetical protein